MRLLASMEGVVGPDPQGRVFGPDRASSVSRVNAVPLWLRTLAVTLVLCCSGNMVLSHVDRRAVVYPVVLALLVVLGALDRRPIVVCAIPIAGLCLMHFLAQSIGLGVYAWLTFAGFLVRISIGLLAARGVSDFGPILVRVLHAVAMLALVVHACVVLALWHQAFAR